MTSYSSDGTWLGSCDGDTFISSRAVRDLDALEWAVRHDSGQSVVVLDVATGRVAARYDRAEAYAADAVCRAVCRWASMPETKSQAKTRRARARRLARRG